jgi:hypothetical protein
MNFWYFITPKFTPIINPLKTSLNGSVLETCHVCLEREADDASEKKIVDSGLMLVVCVLSKTWCRFTGVIENTTST